MKCSKCNMEYPHNSMIKVSRDERIEADGIFRTLHKEALLCSCCQQFIKKDNSIIINGKTYYK